ncbi:hypothetical protein CHX26_09550 [Porphyrobacter sp. HT-58-2]|uniref:hypothetical protein n=1 Tax=Porphyrobacter sp. HT-58-2 TaxID=2023229 RepID=UPI000CDC83B9|nr:hypothetical protein [Porphyrobacter sp. HT-58-2]AUX69710.1 hypothetical protein CHX26_09550 [Porphyrobacter sp. HT-58-2]
MIPARHLPRHAALLTALCALWLVLGESGPQATAAAQTDAASEARALQARVDQLTTRLAALETLVSRQGRTMTFGGTTAETELVLRARPDTQNLARIGKADAVLQFDRITLMGKEITIDARRAIRLDAPAITLRGHVEAKDIVDVPLKGIKARDN